MVDYLAENMSCRKKPGFLYLVDNGNSFYFIPFYQNLSSYLKRWYLTKASECMDTTTRSSIWRIPSNLLYVYLTLPEIDHGPMVKLSCYIWYFLKLDNYYSPNNLLHLFFLKKMGLGTHHLLWLPRKQIGQPLQICTIYLHYQPKEPPKANQNRCRKRRWPSRTLTASPFPWLGCLFLRLFSRCNSR